MTWALLETGFLPAQINMNIDVALAHHTGKSNGIPILRFYGWNPPAISIGYNQDEQEFDPQKLHSAGIDLVRRPTGGRAILHWNELTYSIVLPIQQRSLHEIYSTISTALLAGVRLLGINAELVNVGNSTEQLYHQKESAACFSSSAKSEIRYQGKKLVGSAQRRFGTVVLQHGSILLGPQHLQIASLLADTFQDREHLIKRHLQDHAIDVETALTKVVTFEEASICLKKGFEQALSITFTEPEKAIDEIVEQILHEARIDVH